MVFSFLKIAGIFPFSASLNGGSRVSKKASKKKTIKKSKVPRKKTISRKNRVKRNLNRKKSIHKRPKTKRIYTQKKRNHCNCDVTRFYKGNEPSPKGLGFCAHCIPINTTMKGLDGNLWENLSYQNGKRWVKIRTDMN